MIPYVSKVAAVCVVSAMFGIGVSGATDGWEKVIAGGGSAALVAGLFVYTTRRTTESHEKVAETFATAVKDSHEKFANTVSEVLREQRSDSAASQQRLVDALKESRAVQHRE